MEGWRKEELKRRGRERGDDENGRKEKRKRKGRALMQHKHGYNITSVSGFGRGRGNRYRWEPTSRDDIDVTGTFFYLYDKFSNFL